MVFDVGISTNQQRQDFHSVRKVRKFVGGSGKSGENFYPCKFLTSIKKSCANRNVFSGTVKWEEVNFDYQPQRGRGRGGGGGSEKLKKW